MATLSLCMIVKNEEGVLDRCLSSVKDVADEIIIVDTGSTDNTKEIAASYTEKIYDFQWIDDFSAARNFSFSKATMDYIMWLDADDVIEPENKHKLLELKSSLDKATDVVMMKYNVAFDSNNNPTFSYYRERLLKRSRNFLWSGVIHEVITPIGNIIYSDAAISHKKIKVNDPDRNLKIYEKLINSGQKLDARQKFYYARELYFHKKYPEAINAFSDFFNDSDKWVENSINACLDLSRCYMSLNRETDALDSLFKSFLYDSPRAEICCEIGNIKFNQKKYREAIFWYKCASEMEYSLKNGGFSSVDCYGYIPYMQLCVCYDKLGEYRKAYIYNNKAGEIKPNDESFLFNKKYFEQKFNYR